MRILRRGSEGDDVRRWQHFLLGQNLLEGGVDGRFGPLTEKATRTFQQRNGLEVGWEAENMVPVTLPQLRGVAGAPESGRIRVHKLAAKQFGELFAAWERDGLSSLVRSWAGSFVPRYVRGSSTNLSNHAGRGHPIGGLVTAAARCRSFSATELSRVRRPFVR
jgi:peptidoglycan hydrolase-like protein with peptidoglycan-binding domain